MAKRLIKGTYEVGDSYVNLCLMILRQAKGADDRMWLAFKGSSCYKQGLRGVPDGFQTAWWVVQYLKEVLY